jgi:benzoyl-CoA reductase/2-hydroxyglutaryl-CoA dehydratase subunit BcrC/BadD/HgdB
MSLSEANPLGYFDQMIDHCYDFAQAEVQQGRPLVGILCEFTPREIILAAGAWPVCLCGGSARTIPSAEQFLPANLCPLIKSTFGYCVQRSNPFLEWADLVVAETTCDGKKKMFELLGQHKPVYILELPQKSNDPDARAHWISEVSKLRDFLRNRYRAPILDEDLRVAILTMNRERALRRQLSRFMEAESPPITGGQLLKCKTIMSGVPETLARFEDVIRWLDAGHRAAVLPSSSGAPVRVLLTGVPTVHGAGHVIEWIEECGAWVVAQENCTGLKPLLEDIDPLTGNLIEAVADKYYHLPCSVMSPNDRRLQTLRLLARQYRADCVIELVWQACLTYDIESLQVRHLAENELHLPYLKITTDYSPTDSSRLKLRIQALLETARNRRVSDTASRIASEP